MTSIDLTDPKLRLQAAGLPTFKPTAKQEKYVRDGLAYLLVRSPFFAHLFYNETHLRYTTVVPFAATDAKSIFMNPDEMEKLGWGIPEVAFVLAHEIGHVIFNDLVLAVKFRNDGYVNTAIGQLPYDHTLMNIAEDFRINAMLIHAKIGKAPSIVLYDPTLSEKGMESSIEIYAKMFQRAGWKKGKPSPTGPSGPGKGKPGHGGFDIHLDPTKDEVGKADGGSRDQAIAAAAEAARASGQGNIPAAIQVLIGEILEPKVSWEDQLRSAVMRHAGEPAYDWRYLDKRLLARAEPMYFARQAHKGAGCIVIMDDTSGSVADINTQQRFFGEMGGIVSDLNPEELVVIWCDAKVQRVDHLEEPEDMLGLWTEITDLGGVPGGGGTDFRPAFAKVEELGIEPDLVVFLTDTYGTFPDHEPHYPVVWASIVENPTVPWGEVVYVEL